MSWRARLSKSLNELRVVYCASSKSSEGTRQFVKANYKDLKAMNPGLPIYIRSVEGSEPHIAARYERGVYAATKTGDMTPKQVLEAVERLEGQAPQINAQNGGGGIGTTFKLADVIG